MHPDDRSEPLPVGRRIKQPGRPYVEGLPSLRAVTLESRFRRGQPVCQWTNESGLVVGYVAVRACEPTGILLAQVFHGVPNIQKNLSALRMPVTRSPRGEQPNRPQFICGSCGDNVEMLHLARQSWACRTCHDLTYVARRLGTLNKLLRHHADLERKIKAGRARYERREAFKLVRRDYGRVLGELVNWGDAELPRELTHAVYPIWLRSEDGGHHPKPG